VKVKRLSGKTEIERGRMSSKLNYRASASLAKRLSSALLQESGELLAIFTSSGKRLKT
jgi:hypothetical protein